MPGVGDMIRFACLCTHRLEVDPDLAGGMVQCPRCGRLNDVPTLSDLPQLSDDGTYKVDVERPKDDPVRLAELSIIYSKGTVDPDGDVIDLRIPAGELNPAAAAETTADDNGDDVIPLVGEEPARRRAARPAPRYDPETGEMIRPVELKVAEEETLDPASIPLARATIGYATGDAARRVTPRGILVELLMPVNVAVMAFIFVTHVLLQLTAMIVLSGMYLIFVAPLVLAIVLIGHYGNVIDDVGPQDHDELPRPMRGVSLSDDLWMPFVHVVFALALCFLPPAAVGARTVDLLPPAVRGAVVLALLAVGVFLLPAVLLTATTSGTLVNLRPDRLVGTIRTCGSGYAVAVVAAAVTVVVYSVGMVAADFAFVRILGGAQGPMPVWAHWAIGYPVLSLGIYLAHFFCWYLGLLYREHHAKFPWVLQRYVPDAAMRRPGRKDTKQKLKALRELERKRRAQPVAEGQRVGPWQADATDESGGAVNDAGAGRSRQPRRNSNT